MIQRIRAVMMYVEDQDRALDFYVNRLGWEKRTDAEMWPGARWLEVAPPGAETPLVLSAAKDFGVTAGEDSSGVTLQTDDVEALHRELVDAGVEIVTPPTEEPWSTYLRFKDPDGHVFLVGEN